MKKLSNRDVHSRETYFNCGYVAVVVVVGVVDVGCGGGGPMIKFGD